ncbi:MAG: hypothetical protein QOD85_430, partial [Gaiellaceae bacterium]|nr:hypothetical protein [Gaiellaceae bacterium]
DDVRRNGVDEAAAEAGACVGGLRPALMRVPFQLDGQQIWTRIKPDDELGALVLDGIGQAIREVRRRDCCHTLRVLRAKDGEGRIHAAFAVLDGGFEATRRPRRSSRPP